MSCIKGMAIWIPIMLIIYLVAGLFVIKAEKKGMPYKEWVEKYDVNTDWNTKYIIDKYTD